MVAPLWSRLLIERFPRKRRQYFKTSQTQILKNTQANDAKTTNKIGWWKCKETLLGARRNLNQKATWERYRVECEEALLKAYVNVGIMTWNDQFIHRAVKVRVLFIMFYTFIQIVLFLPFETLFWIVPQRKLGPNGKVGTMASDGIQTGGHAFAKELMPWWLWWIYIIATRTKIIGNILEVHSDIRKSKMLLRLWRRRMVATAAIWQQLQQWHQWAQW